jgi:hypothetical protein
VTDILYTLADDGMTPVPCADLVAWGRWMQTAERRVSQDYDEGDDDATIRVSTVFLGVDHSHGGGPPLLWETMVFGGPLDGETARYPTHAEAVTGHQAMCRLVRAALSP